MSSEESVERSDPQTRAADGSIELRNHPDLASLAEMGPGVSGRLLHLAGRSESHDGASVLALHLSLRNLGFTVHAVSEPAVDTRGQGYSSAQVQGVTWHTTPGLPRPEANVARWALRYLGKVNAVLRKVRPVAVLADGDAVCQEVAAALGLRHGLPVVTVGSPTAAIQGLESACLLAAGASAVVSSQVSEADVRMLASRLPESPAPLERRHRVHDRKQAREIRSSGWRHSGLPPLIVGPEMNWTEIQPSDRSHALWLHAWGFMRPALGSYASYDDVDSLDWCFGVAESWCRAFPDAGEVVDEAWYDMALSLRLPKLAFLTQEATRLERWATATTLLRSVVAHERELLRPRSFMGHNNHGLYTALAQLALSRRLPGFVGAEGMGAQGERRLRALIDNQFAPDGGHKEHSPGYHNDLVKDLAAALDDGLVEDADLRATIESARDALHWFARPDQTISQIGDTSCRPLSTRDTDERAVVFPDSGYAMVRDLHDEGDPATASYLTLAAAFHSRTHKHADDLSLTWFDRGQEILIDAGRWGYRDPLPSDHPDRAKGFFYSRPERQYVEGTNAHSTVQVDGANHERVARKPYGSGIVSLETRGREHRLVGEVPHGSWAHRRTVVLQPGESLLVVDELSFKDDEWHDVSIWWQLPGELELVSEATEGQCVVFGGRELAIELRHEAGGEATLETVRGAENPLQGWRSREDRDLSPSWSVAQRVVGRRQLTVVSRLVLAAR